MHAKVGIRECKLQFGESANARLIVKIGIFATL
jgi:hypothetical protein